MCIKHGAKVKRCNSEGCTNHVQKGGVCIKHGAKVEHKRCNVDGCTSFVVKGGVCKRHGAKVKLCSAVGCTNNVVKGGVCVRHGAKVKLCSVEGCTNHSKRGGVCWRHGAYGKHNDESTAFASRFGSDFDKTTLTCPNQRTPAASASQGSVPEEVAVCVVIANNHVEV